MSQFSALIKCISNAIALYINKQVCQLNPKFNLFLPSNMCSYLSQICFFFRILSLFHHNIVWVAVPDLPSNFLDFVESKQILAKSKCALIGGWESLRILRGRVLSVDSSANMNKQLISWRDLRSLSSAENLTHRELN